MLSIITLFTGCATRHHVTLKESPCGDREYKDRSWSINQPFAAGPSVPAMRSSRLFRLEIGGGGYPGGYHSGYYGNSYGSPIGGGYGYGSGGYGYYGGSHGYSGGYYSGYPVITVPAESQQHYMNQTAERYGLKGDHGHR